MPHQCTKCGRIFDDTSQELLKGCADCGGKFFFYIKKEKLKEKQPILDLSTEEKKQIEEDVLDIVGANAEDDQPVILDLEAIKISKPGSYELDIVKLFGDKPVVYKLEEGKYVIDLVDSFAKMRAKK